MASSFAKETGDVPTANSHKACSDGGSGKNKCNNGKPSTEGRVSSKEPIYHGCGQKEK